MDDAPLEQYAPHATLLGELPIRRLLPVRQRRLVGPWCFLDRYGPLTFAGGKPMDVAPHPHAGLQTVTWLLDGEVVHHDSLGGEGLIRPGALSLMTAGSGIAHAEESPSENSGKLNGVQLWVALPDAHRHTAAHYEHHAEMPQLELPGCRINLIAGEMAGQVSPAQAYSPILGASITVDRGREVELPLQGAFEHAVVLLTGDLSVEGQELARDTLYYAGTARRQIGMRSREGARVLLIGGAPFGETILMWWNFVARTPEEIAAVRLDWEEHRRFGDVKVYRGPRISAPEFMHLRRS